MRVPPMLCALLLSVPFTLTAAEWKLTIEAGDLDRRDTIVSFKAPEGMDGKFLMRSEDGEPLPMQVDRAGRGVFIEPRLAKGAHKTYRIVAASGAKNTINARQDQDVVKVAVGDRPLFQYQTTPGAVPEGVPEHFRHGAHLHPVFSPSGKLLTANHPPDHRWHRGIWLGWTDTDFEGRHPDFWNEGKEKDGKLTGEVRFASLDEPWSGPVQAGFTAHHRFIDHTSGAEKDVLTETWDIAATRLPSANVIDLTSTQTIAGTTPLKLPKYYYGGLGVRGNRAWDAADQVTMLTSNGDDRMKGDNSHAKWVQMGGSIDGAPCGMAILIHPENFRFPQPLRLNPKNPQLCVAPSQDGDWSIEPGKPYVSRYRILALDGEADATEIERAWNDYATPPKVTVERAAAIAVRE